MSIEQEYQGYLKTHYLFNPCHKLPFDIFQIPLRQPSSSPNLDLTKLRLGNRVEQYVFHHLKANNFTFLATNIQVISDGITLGEIDCLLARDKEITHVEIVCKFYLYDKSVGHTEFDHWIGPNRKDSLVEKINKLHLKQLPLLHNSITSSVLKSKGIIKVNTQKVFFIGQLFVPYKNKKVVFKEINAACVSGSYISVKDIIQLKDHSFYIPTKQEWLQKPNQGVNWINFELFKEELAPLLNIEKSPMCWMLDKHKGLEKIFITWW